MFPLPVDRLSLYTVGMAQSSRIPAIERATERDWDDWLAFLDNIGASDLSHAEIAQAVFTRLNGSPANSGWWAQGVTIAYEQHIGRRIPGQSSAGDYAVSVTKTVSGTIEEGRERWLAFVRGRAEFGDVAITSGPTQSESEKWRYWRCGLEDGTRVTVSFTPKAAAAQAAGEGAPAKSLLAVNHTKLESIDEVEHWRALWKAVLAEFSGAHPATLPS
ncbi:hypothetical protein GCM10022198_24330 [Klugiella xanthotipulae]